MPIITISRGSYSHGKEVAEKVAVKLGYECIGRDILVAASKEFDVDEIKLVRAVGNAPSFLDKLSYGKQRYIAYIRAALLARLKHDNAVYHGLAGQFFVRDVSHALKVRIIADIEERVRLVMARDNVSDKVAHRFIKRIDNERRKWSQQLYGVDTFDPSLYDMVLHIGAAKLTADDAAEIICCTSRLARLQATEESRLTIEDDALAAAVKAVLVKHYPNADITAQDGVVFVTAKATAAEAPMVSKEIEQAAKGVPGVKDVRVHLQWITPFAT